MPDEWWTVLIAPVFCIGMFVWIGMKFKVFDRIKTFFENRSQSGISWRPNFNVIRFEGIAKFFRRE